MISSRTIRFDYLVSLGCLALLAYFAWHAWYGPRGKENIVRLNQKLAALQVELAEAQTRKTALATKVTLMRPEAVDPDLLDELARKELNLAGPMDLIIRSN